MHWFEHDGQMTKREIRAVTLSALAMRRGELLWDIGLGAGSVAIEWLLRDPANRAIGFEKNAERAARAARNAKALGVPQLVRFWKAKRLPRWKGWKRRMPFLSAAARVCRA